MENIVTRRRLRIRIAVAIVLLGIAAVVMSPIRLQILRGAGHILIVNDPVEPADVIVVTVGAGGPGVLEAADLVHAGVAPRVAVFGEPPDGMVETEFARRGVAYENAAQQSIRYLRALSVDTVDLIPTTYVTGSEDETGMLADWCEQHGFHSVVVVSNSDHSRRIRRMLHRSMKGHQTKVITCSSPYSGFDPDRWWQSRRGVRTEVVELQKLLFDMLRHPIS
jgi:uncharacterized SAM-binding protein YcdF (DUF218 family)